jgi:hypothetical protein
MEAICSSETSVDTQRTTRRYIPEDGTLPSRLACSLIVISLCSNVRIACSLQPTLGLSAWLEKDVPMKISDEILSQAVEKAEADVKLRRQREYQLWAKSN